MFRWAELPTDDWVALNAKLRGLVASLTARVGDGSWEAPLTLNGSSLWVDGTGDLRIKATAPTSDTDGSVVGTQS